MKWIINPFVGLGPLKFGMKLDEVGLLNPKIGLVTATDKLFDGSIAEYRSLHSPVCNYADEKLVAVDTSWRCQNVFFKEIEVYSIESRDLMQLLQEENKGAQYGLGYVLFDKLGINTRGFCFENSNQRFEFFEKNLREQDERGVAVYQKGGFNHLMKHFKPIKF